MTTQSTPKTAPTWPKVVKAYQNPDRRSWIQIFNTFVPLFITYGLMYYALIEVSYLLTLLLGVVAAGLTVRVFIIQHDAGHGSFFKNNTWNDRIGIFCSLFTLTPYEFWRKSHAIHHAHNGDLEHRGTGDVYTMTFEEYKSASPRQRLWYRIYRHPIMMILVGPPLMFIVLHRSPFAWSHARSKAERMSLIRTDLMFLGVVALFSLLIGWQSFLLIWLPTAMMTASMGVWMFYVQHQFEDAYWTVKPEWDYAEAALHGSTFYRLPKVLQWFTGNIGFHHIHHLSPKIPNYELERCHKENQEFQEVPTLTIRSSIALVLSNLAVFDQEANKLISFKAAHAKIKALEIEEAAQQKPSVSPAAAGTD